MIPIEALVNAKKVEMPCPKSGCGGKMEYCDGEVLTSFPAQYPHRCTKCGYEEYYRGITYPQIKFEAEQKMSDKLICGCGGEIKIFQSYSRIRGKLFFYAQCYNCPLKISSRYGHDFDNEKDLIAAFRLATRADKQGVTRKQIRKIIELTALTDPDGSVYGYGHDTECGKIEEIIDWAVRIINLPEKAES